MPSSPPNILIRPIPPALTHALRHSVLWPDRPMSYVILDEDDSGWHFGAFLGPAPDSGASSASASAGRPADQAGDDSKELDQPVSVISCFLEPLSGDNAPGSAADVQPSRRTARFRKFATAPAQRNLGIGSALLQHTLDFLARPEAEGGKGAGKVWCDARWEARGFYERFGMRVVRAEGEAREGPTFWKGEIPYVRMVRELEGGR